MLTSYVVAGWAFAVGALAAPQAEDTASSRCKEVNFKVSGTANNYNITSILSGNLTQTIPAAVVSGVLPALVSVTGTQTLAGYYCQPYIQNKNSGRLQVFRGSFFTNRESWTALGGTPLFNPPLKPFDPNMYSWVEYANKLGYPTLAIDTLGDGASGRPDPVVVVQIPYQLAIYHDLIKQIRAGTTGQLPTKYSQVIHVGNSLGSTIGSQMAIYYPDDFDQIILTGWSSTVLPSLGGVSLNNPTPAVLVNSTRFAGLPVGYVTSTSQTALTNSFFGNPKFVDFDPAVAALFYQRRDVVSLGDVVTTYLLNGDMSAPKYKGRVLALTGQYDQAYCGPGSAAINPAPMTCPTLLKTSKSLFPAADYNYQIIPRTGHAIVFHKTAQVTFGVAHAFLAGASFGK